MTWTPGKAAGVLFRLDPTRLALGVVNEDAGISVPTVGEISIGDRIVESLVKGGAFEIVRLDRSEMDEQFRNSSVGGGLALSEDLSTADRTAAVTQWACGDQWLVQRVRSWYHRKRDHRERRV